MPSTRPTLTALRIAAEPDRWRAVGVPLDGDGRSVVGGVLLDVAPAGDGEEEGLRAWEWDGLRAEADLDGLITVGAPPPGTDAPTSTSFSAVDHVVVLTGDLDRTVASFDAAGLDRRRIRDAGAMRQAFYVAGPALVEVAAPAEPTSEPSRLWGITFVSDDLDATAMALGDLIGDVRDAVQPGRRIATITRDAGLGLPVAVMTRRR